MAALLSDLRFALRSLGRSRTFTAVALATIALSIGAATAMFSVVDAVLFRSLPYSDPGKLVAVWQTYPEWKKEPILAARAERIPLDYGDFVVWRDKQTSFSSIGLWSARAKFVVGPTETQAVQVARISPSLFETVGVRPLLGRGLLPGEDVVGGPHVAVISYETWQTKFGGRPDVLGRSVQFEEVNASPWTIVGVMPRGFTLERGKPPVAYWLPAGQDKSDLTDGNHVFNAIARLKPGVTMEQAWVETRHLLQGDVPPAKRGVRLTDYHRDETKDVRTPLLLLLGAVGLLVVIACVNIATLLLCEGAARQREMSTRIALGASRGRLIRQLLTESITLSVAGGIAGALLAWWATRALVAIAPDRVPGIDAVQVDLRVLAIAMSAAVLTGAVFGLLPALVTSGAGVAATLRTAHQSAAGRGALQRTLIAVELALSVLLLVGAALLARSLNQLTIVDPGFRPHNLLVVRLMFPGSTFDSVGRKTFYQDGVRRLGALPGVDAVTAVGGAGIPFAGNWTSSGYVRAGEPEDAEHWRPAMQSYVAPEYFAVMGIRMLAGRTFTSADGEGAPPVAIVSEAAARRDWPYESALGKKILYQRALRTIVGISGDAKYERLSKDAEPMVFTPIAQRSTNAMFVVRTRGEPAAMIPTVRGALREVASAVVIPGINVMDDLMRRSFSEERFRTTLISLFAAMAAVLAAVGMYGVTARAVSGRTHEVGIRVALGATSSAVVRMIMTHTVKGVAMGVAAGGLASIAASRLLAPYLFGIGAYDTVAYAGVFALLAAVSLVASWLPARRAGRVSPASVLRGD